MLLTSGITLQRNCSPISHPLKPPLYVHIGHGKTASTTLQRALQINADTIRSHGLLVSDKRLNFPQDGPINGHPVIMLEEMIWRLPPEESERRLKTYLEPLYAAINERGFRGAVISSENLYNEPAPRFFCSVSQDFDLRVLYLVRRQDEWLESAWKQWGMKSGATLLQHVEGQLAAGEPAFLASARRWKAIGAEMRVVPLHAINDIPALVYDWLGITDCTPLAVPRMNETLDYSVLDVLSRNPFLFSSVSDNTVFKLFDELLTEDPPRVGYGLLPNEIRERIMAYFREENETLHREFFPGFKPLDHYPMRSKGEPPKSSIESIQRYLGINLLLIKTLRDRLDEASEHIQALNSQQHSLMVELGSIITGPRGLDDKVGRLKADLKELKQLRKDDSALLNELASTFPVSLFLSMRRAWRKMRRKTRQPR